MLLISFNSYALLPTESDDYDKKSVIINLDAILKVAEENATLSGRKILETGRLMVANEDIIIGSCWDFINAVYINTGFPSAYRKTTFKSKLVGPYDTDAQIESGDWLYFINHSYGNVEHSGIFIAWTNLETKQALVLSYAGGNQAKPGRYKMYDLRSVYNIIRTK